MHLTIDSPETRLIKAIFLNEKDITEMGVIELDTEEEWAVVYDRDEEGLLLVDEVNHTLKKKKLFGEITIHWLNKDD